MQITNEIILGFIHCPYKAYRKYKSENGDISDYEKLCSKLKYSQKLLFSEKLSSENRLIATQSTERKFAFTEGILVDQKFSNSNVEIILDGAEFIGKNKIIPLLITPFEKVTRIDKLLISFQTFYLQNEFHFQVDHCKIVFGKDLKQTKFQLISFLKAIKKNSIELNKILLQPNHPVFNRNIHCQICEFQDDCIEKLKERDDLSLLTGLKPKEILQKNNRGLFSVKQLSYNYRPKKNPYRKRKFLPELKALAIREEKVFILEIPVFKQVANEVFLDFEGIPDKNLYYLIGVILRTNDMVTEYSFWADDSSEEEDIFIKLIELLKPLDDFQVYHYGSFEIQALQRIAKKISQENKVSIVKIIENSFNLLNIFTQNIYPPTYSNSLKEIARFLKFEWTDKDASGLQSIVWRYNWEISKSTDLKNILLQYNIEDCKALIKVKNWLSNIPKGENEEYKKTDCLKSQTTYKFGKNKFLFKELEQINNFAYFDYQRNKVFFKTNPDIIPKRSHTKSKKLISHKVLKPNRIIEIPIPPNCPVCNGKEITRQEKKKRVVIDLKFTKTGLRRLITQYNTSKFRCKFCNRTFTPKNFMLIPVKYDRNINCWIINQHIYYNLSYNKILSSLKESFDIDYKINILSIKSNFVEFYRDTLSEIFACLKKGLFIHIDETAFNLNRERCYVWVFANIDTVYYLFRYTRESDFLKDLLLDFRGVIISDFYAGYDAIDCPKQRCLIHLIRDMNDDLITNQLNEEFKVLSFAFSKLLNEIILTINRYGLKKRNLGKHKKKIALFFNHLSSIEFETDICEKWKRRFLSYQNELFTFIYHNGVPWNNNNAENAIKAIAIYRRNADGLVTPKSIQEHLYLLSIQQTCKYRSINFFEFLKSGKKSIFEYSKK